ncbi:MAG TPA: hypothetical protein VFZ09_19815 [Archangium sp.]|uniref:hypothetical protein n=1 Tax=Archangium sp. TaxID=1872627 RepID=UPI002E37CB7A|nr:hypothetical protein [Archangium sp.]HEX5748496.1 hypothetical protein [Archangium sp.]
MDTRHCRLPPTRHGLLLVALLSLACSGPLPPTQLVFLTQPGRATVGTRLAPAIQLKALDAEGMPVSGVTVSLSLETNPGQGTLSGSTTASTNAMGIASFEGLSIDSRGMGYTLAARAEPKDARALVTVSSPFAVFLLDQQQPSTSSEAVSAIGGESEQKLAQVVTAGSDGYLGEVALPVSCASGELRVEIRGVQGELPDGTLLASRTVPSTGLPSSDEFTRIAFPEPVALSAGTRFAIVLSSSGDCGLRQGPVGNPYPGGDGFFDSRPNAPGEWVPLSIGDGRSDLPFQTFLL